MTKIFNATALAKFAQISDVVDAPKNTPAGNLSEHFSTDEFTCHHCGSIGDGMIFEEFRRACNRCDFDAIGSLLEGYR